jgi:rhodanese-related sulfurtransferase
LLARAAFAAHWLRRMGWDAAVIDGPPPALAAPVAASPPPAPALDAAALHGAIAAGALVLDLRSSAAFEAERIAEAVWCVRGALAAYAAEAPLAIVVDDARAGAFAAVDLEEAGASVLGVHVAAPEAWRANGLDVRVGGAPIDPVARIDVDSFCPNRHRGDLSDARAYLAWETGLLNRLRAAGLSPWPADVAASETDPFAPPGGSPKVASRTDS